MIDHRATVQMANATAYTPLFVDTTNERLQKTLRIPCAFASSLHAN